MKIRRSNERGKAQIDWLNSRFSFSFSHYYDPEHMGFQTLRVLNDDEIQPSAGFGMHPHRNMEIITFMLEGELKHQDSLGNSGVIRPGQIQIMSAGRGIVHSEFNPSNKSISKLLQIWIEPKTTDTNPLYSEFYFADKVKTNKLNLIVSGDQQDEVGHINQDVKVYYLDMDNFSSQLKSDKSYWLQMIEGSAIVNGEKISSGDAAALEKEELSLTAGSGRALLFELS